MFSAIKKLFGRKSAVETYTRVPETEPDFNPPETVAPAPLPPVTRAVPVPSRRPFTPKPANGSGLSLPLKAILTRLSPELMRLVRLLDVGDAAITLPLPNIISQIPRGSVKITFGELRAASPPGVFANDVVLDQSLVEIPLQEIICRLDPALLSKRPAQQQVVIPEDVSGPFGNQENKAPLITAKAPVAAPAPAPAPAQAAAPAASPVIAKITKGTEHATKPVVRVRATPSKVPVTAAPTVAPAVAQAQPVTPIAQSIPAKSFETSKFKKNSAPGNVPASVPLQEILNRAPAPAPAPVEAAPRVYTPIDPTPISESGDSTPTGPISMGDFARNFSPQTPITPISPEPIPEPQPIRFHTAPPAVAPVVTEPPAAPVADGRTLTVSLAELSAAWPEPVQKEITLRQLSAATMHLPVAMIEVAIKQGKVALPWRVLRSWVQPAGLPGASTYDAMVLELPLKVITPLFLADLKTGKRQKKIVIDPTIPDLFSGGAPAENDAAVHRATDEIAEVEAAAPAPAPAPARTSTPGTMFLRTTSLPPMPLPVEPPPLQKGNTLPVNSGLVVKKPQDTNYFGKEPAQAAEDVTEPLVKQGGSLSTAFLNRYATPNEIVAKAMAIEGVDGALIALPDGLLVASQIPPTMNAETVAAFLPQLYGKVSQCTKELRLGDLNNINFTVGQIPWKIYKVGAIYFAAFGRAGEPLPTAQIAAVVGELDRNGK